MAETISNIKIGLANYVVSVSAYVTAKGGGTFTDVGALEQGSELDWSEESVDIFTDKHLGPVSQEPIKRGANFKCVMKEVTLANLQTVLGAVAGDLTGVAPNQTLEPGVDNPAQYLQLKAVLPGTGTTGVRTIIMWRARRTGNFKYKVTKEKEQLFETTFALMEEISGAAPASFWKATDA